MKKWLLILLMFLASPAVAQTAGDRHDNRNPDTDVVDKGHFTLEIITANTESETSLPYDTLIHYGLGDNMEVQLSLSPKGNPGTVLGDMDLSIRKQYDSGKFHFAIQPFAIIPGRHSSVSFSGGAVLDLHYVSGPFDFYMSPQVTVNSKAYISQLYGSSYQVNKQWTTRIETFNLAPNSNVWYFSTSQEVNISKIIQVQFRISKTKHQPAEEVMTLVFSF